MRIPISFDEVAYFNNAYRGDLIITEGIIYYFPHTNVEQDRYSELPGKEEVWTIGRLLGFVVPILAMSGHTYALFEILWKTSKFLRRTFRPTNNRPRIREKQLWFGEDSSKILQDRLNDYIEERKKDSPEIMELSLPRPMRFPVENVKNLKIGLKLTLDTEFDDHDFRVNLFHRSKLKTALKEAGFVSKS